jgi:hypothetical protein
MQADISLIRLIDAMNERPIAFNRHYVSLGCGITGALMLSQMVYWTKYASNNGWFYKTSTEWEQETGMTRREQETARKNLVKLKFIQEELKGVPGRLHFRVEKENLYQALINLHQVSEENQCTNPPNSDGGIRQSNTENTHESTQESITSSATVNFSAKKYLLNIGVTEQVAKDFLDLRTKKKKPLTELAIKLIAKQAEKASLPVCRALEICIVRGWESFKADWAWQDTNAELDQLFSPAQSTEQVAQESQPTRFQPERVQFGKGLV